jgi:hypothetical protein
MTILLLVLFAVVVGLAITSLFKGCKVAIRNMQISKMMLAGVRNYPNLLPPPPRVHGLFRDWYKD